MQARIELAILDHNYNTNRKQATTKKGMLKIFNNVYNTSNITMVT